MINSTQNTLLFDATSNDDDLAALLATLDWIPAGNREIAYLRDRAVARAISPIFRANGYAFTPGWTGRQAIYRTRLYPDSAYDIVAAGYDGMFENEQHLREDRAVFALLCPGPDDEILDIGAGTGLLPALFKRYTAPLFPDRYAAVEPSVQMSLQFMAKHPELADSLTICPADQYYPGPRRFDQIAMLYGVMSYIEPDTIARFTRYLKPKGRIIGMKFLPGHLSCDEITGITPARSYRDGTGPHLFGKYSLEIIQP